MRGVELRLHAARAEFAARAAGQPLDLRREPLDDGDELRRGIAVRVGREQTVDVRKQDEEVCPDRPGDDGGQRVVVANAQLLRGDGVVFVDDRQRAQLQQPCESVVEVFRALRRLDVVRCDEQLRHDVVVLRVELIINVHQLALADGRSRLLAGNILRPLGQRQLADTHGDGTGRYQHQLMPCIFEIAADLAQLLHAADVQIPRRVRERGRPQLEYDSHGSRLLTFLL